MFSSLFWAALILTAQAVSRGEVSLYEESLYQGQRPCARNCFGLLYLNTPDKMGSALGCDVQTMRNDCFCRADLQTSAHSWLSKCVPTSCDSPNVDIAIATQVYDSYCSQASRPPSGKGVQPRQTVTAMVATGPAASGASPRWELVGVSVVATLLLLQLMEC
ncbi:unnamed protein product [Parascedosporium putredinis]|uniref:Extracellular membrane protein CFEM domain-containing protein n=1 Tax=Parascedosporium putredinis TaxID=1442378 RepID=A0A9P1H198_9PEZI|nr:unnamed protein product [Parascedosporium putredinis]CAI7993456.1 unnamed protein product [Parascedosporium putredinis]